MRLTHARIVDALAKHDGWVQRGDALEKTFDCGSFDGSIAFVNAIATLANEHDHHPDLAISWDRVTVTTTSHDLEGITNRDVALAGAIDALAQRRRDGDAPAVPRAAD